MASIRRGYSDDFVIKNNKVGIGSSNPQETLDVVGGVLQGQDLKVTGVSTQTGYTGFLRSKHEIEENTTLRRSKISDQGGNVSSLSGEIIVGTGITVTIDSVGVGTTVVGVGTETTTNIITPSNITQAGSGQLNSLKVFNTFTPPSGGTNERPAGAKPGQLFYNYDLKTIEFYDGNGWRQVDNTTRSGRAVFAGGYITGNVRTKEMMLIQIHTRGNATYFGDLANDETTDKQGVSSQVRGVFAGGYNAGRRVDMDYITIASEGNGIDFGNLTIVKNSFGSASSSTRGLFAGGATSTPTVNSTNVIDYIQISTLGDALDFGDLTNERTVSGGISSPTRGVFGAGDDYAAPAWTGLSVGTLDYSTFASKGNAVDFGEDSVARIQGNGCGNGIRGCWTGGYIAPTLGGSAAERGETARAMTYVTIASTGNAIQFGTLTMGSRYYIGASSTSTRGIWTGGSSYPVHHKEIDYVNFASLGDSLDFGDLYREKGYMTGSVSDSHGGLGGF